jgi:micrococcal nuclease
MHPATLSAAGVALAVFTALVGCGSDSSAPPEEAGAGQVVSVVDGDTLVVRHDGLDDRVRLLGIDTPELGGPYTEEECFGRQASARMRALAAPGDTVRLETDPTQDTRDRNDRLLAYVYRDGDSWSLNERMVAEGFARVFAVGRPFAKAADFWYLERAARSGRQGMWGACGEASRPRVGSTSGTSRDCPPNRPIKGNLPSGIYHAPGNKSYAETAPEKCFATPADAERAGFRPART